MEQKIKNTDVVLESVWCIVDNKNRTYPILKNKLYYDDEAAVPLYQCCNDWFEALSDKDYLKIQHRPGVPRRKEATAWVQH